MHFAVYGNSCAGSEKYVEILFRELLKGQDTVSVFKPLYDLIKEQCSIDVSVCRQFNGGEDFPSDGNFLISLGGDGTFLKAITLVRDRGIPMVGINTGRLGFLANIPKDEITQAIDSIRKNRFTIEERSLIQIETSSNVFPDFPYALNEVSFQKNDPSMITIHVHINEEYINSYWADGLIISTPTGSTAYSLGVGGPVLYPQLKNLIIIPIAPHNLSVRPLIVPDNMELSIRVDSRSHRFQATIDAQSVVMQTTEIIKVRRADFFVKMLKFEGRSFYATLRNKLLWGVDKRN